MFVADVKCSQATWHTVPNSRTGSAKASVSEAVVRKWHRTRYQRKTEGIVGCLRRRDVRRQSSVRQSISRRPKVLQSNVWRPNVLPSYNTGQVSCFTVNLMHY